MCIVVKGQPHSILTNPFSSFKPQTVNVSVVFLEIIAFIFGEATTFIPRWGPVGRFLNPHDFTQKEHVFITIMASAAATCALGTEQLAVQSLYYNETPNAGSAIFMLLSSQMLGMLHCP